MKQTITATYKDGVFHPDKPCDLPEGAKVELEVGRSGVRPPMIADPEERRRVAAAVVESMKDQPLPADFPKLTRDQMHERR